MGSLPSSRLTRILQEKAELLKKRRQSAETVVHDAEERLKNLESIQITLPETKDRVGQIREMMRRSDWEGVEGQAKQLLEYIESSAGPAVASRQSDILERAGQLSAAGVPLSEESTRLAAALREPSPDEGWGDRVRRLAGLDAAIVADENAYSARLRTQATALLDWLDEPAERRAELEQKFRVAFEPIHRGRLTEALDGLNRTLLAELPRLTQRRDATRAAGTALLAVSRELGVDSAALEASLAADAERPPIDWRESISAVEQASQAVADSLKDRVGQTVESLRGTLESVREFGPDPGPGLTELAGILTAVPSAGPAELPKLLHDARALVEAPVVAIVAGLLDEVRPKLVEARRLGRDPSEVFAAMNRAREALRLKIYSEALAASQEALDRVGDLTRDLDAARVEAASLHALLERLAAAGFAAGPYREPLERALQLLERVELEPARQILNETIRKLGAEAIAYFSEGLLELRRTSEIARERGFVPDGFDELLGKVGRHLEDGEIAEGGELLADLEVRLRTAAAPYVARRVEEISKGFEDFPEKSLLEPVRLLLADADVFLRVKEDLPASLESLRKAEREFAAIFAAHASALVEGLEEERRNLEAMGGTGDELQLQIDEVQQIFNMGDFVKASRASQEIRTRAHQQMLLRSEEAVSHAKLALVELGKMELEPAALREAFESAQEEARQHRYAPAYTGAVGVERNAAELRKAAQEFLDTLEEVNAVWQALKSTGVAVDGYPSEIQAARQRYRALEIAPALADLVALRERLTREREGAEARRLLGEAGLLVEDAQRLGLPIDPLSAKSRELASRAAGADGAAVLGAAGELHRELVGLVRPVLDQHLKDLDRDLEIAQSAGLEAPEVVELLGDARRRLAAPVPTGVAERLDAARTRLSESRGFLEHAERLCRRAREALGEAELAHVDVTSLRPRVEELDRLLGRREYLRVIELAGGVEREIVQATYHRVAKTLAAFQGMTVRAREGGSDTTLTENLLKQARTALEEGRPLEALQRAATSETELERVELQRQVAEGSLQAAESRFRKASVEGVVARGAEPLLGKARAAFDAHRFSEVLELCIEGVDQIALAETGHRRAHEALESAERQLSEATRFSADPVEALPVLEQARSLAREGSYSASVERAREATERARWAIERVYAGSLTEIRGQLETGRRAGLLNELDAVIGPLEDAEGALKAREWEKANRLLERARESAYQALDRAAEARWAEVAPLYEEPGPLPEAEQEARMRARSDVSSAASRHAYDLAFQRLAEERTRITERRRRELGQRLDLVKERIWVGEKLGGETRPVMELLSEARLALDAGQFPRVAPLLERADGALAQIVAPRVSDRLRELQTELVFAEQGLHVVLGPIPERLAEVERRATGGEAVAAGRLLLEQEQDLNQRKSMHRELLNLSYLIDAGLAKAAEASLDVAEARKLLDESMRARATDYALALEKARGAHAELQRLLRAADTAGGPGAWPFRRPPT